jgi:outer membrane protein
LEIKDYISFIPSVVNTDSIEFYHYNHIDILGGIDYLPEIALAKKNIELSKKSMQISKAQYYPTLSLSLVYGSSFSNARQKVLQNEDGSYLYNSYPFWEQYKDNVSQYISLGLSIPLFTNSSINSVRKAKLELKRNEYAFYTAKKQAEKEITQVMMDVETAWKKFQGSKKYLASAHEAKRQITLKFEAGAVWKNRSMLLQWSS